MSAVVRFLIRHPAIHRTVHRYWPKHAPYVLPDGAIQFGACPIDALLWRRFIAIPGVAASIEAGRADIAAGRFERYVWRDGELVHEITGEPLA